MGLSKLPIRVSSLARFHPRKNAFLASIFRLRKRLHTSFTVISITYLCSIFCWKEIHITTHSLGPDESVPDTACVEAMGAVALLPVCGSSLRCEDCNTCRAHHWSPFPLRIQDPVLTACMCALILYGKSFNLKTIFKAILASLERIIWLLSLKWPTSPREIVFELKLFSYKI